MNLIIQTLAGDANLASVPFVNRGWRLLGAEGSVTIEQPDVILPVGGASMPRPKIAITFDLSVHRIIIEKD